MTPPSLSARSARASSRFSAVAALAVAAALVLVGCSGTDPLADKYGNGGTSNYQSSDGTMLEIAEANRSAAPTYAGQTDAGLELSSDDFAGDVVVVNFWYAACGPCRAEAPDLQDLFLKYQDAGVSFVGVNTVDEPDTALAFARKYGITYPSVMDGKSGAVRLAFAGQASPSAVPTTLVLDKDGRVAARFLGQIQAPSALDAVIRDLLAEEL